MQKILWNSQKRLHHHSSTDSLGSKCTNYLWNQCLQLHPHHHSLYHISGWLWSSPDHLSPPQSSTTTYMTRSYSQSLKPSKSGDTTLKVQLLQSTSSQTTKILNISWSPNSLPDDKSISPNICHKPTLSFVSTLANLDPNPTLWLDDGMSTLRRKATTRPL